MLAAFQDALRVDVGVCAAAVADWRVKATASQKLKKEGGSLPALELAENPDILATLSRAGRNRPALVVGFAAETEKLEEHARAKLERKNCDLLVANLVGKAARGGGFDATENEGLLLKAGGETSPLPRESKRAMAGRILDAVAALLPHR
jgi:phosphopantothenoylcysteine decarboxylase/phosphopantothenate--cysteine ligase